MQALSWIFLSLIAVSSSDEYLTYPRGKKYSEDPSSEYRLYFQDDQGNFLSPWHDIPLFNIDDPSNTTYNMIVEIPRFSQAKFEINREYLLNPIVQDHEDNHLRYIPNVFPWHGHICNYGAFPQTWENPFHEDEWTGLKGDKDPIDVCEVGRKALETGTVLPVKVLGILALLQGGETDWKVIVMNEEEANKEGIETLEDLTVEYPDLLDTVRKFFKVYGVPAGKPFNSFAFDGEVKDENFAKEVISRTNLAWRDMINNCTIAEEGVGSFNTGNTLQDSDCTIDQDTSSKEVIQQNYDPEPAERPDILGIWDFIFYVSLEDHSLSSTTSALVSGHLVLLLVLIFYLI